QETMCRHQLSLLPARFRRARGTSYSVSACLPLALAAHTMLSRMPRTRVKICGITRPDDAIAAAKYGADAIGVVLHPRAPRNVSIEAAREILAALPPFVTPVLLFVDQPPQAVLDRAAALNVRHVQLHGEETPEEIAELAGLTVIKAI